MRKYILSLIPLVIGITSWITKLILDSHFIYAKSDQLYELIGALAGYELLSGIMVIIGFIFVILGFKRNKNIFLLILNILISCSYLITYAKMINLIMQQ